MVLGSASLHVFWNLLVKTSGDKVSFAFLTTLVGTVFAVCLFALSRWLTPGPLSPAVIGLAGISGFIEAGYIIVLFSAYQRVDLSVAYPLSRGFAPLVAMLPGALLVGDDLALPQVAGVLGIVAGVGCVGWSALQAAADRQAARRGVFLSMVTGVLIAGYHLVDREAMTLHPTPAPLEYFALMHLSLMTFIGIWIGSHSSRRRRAFREWHGNQRAILLVGILSVVAYALIIAALAHGNVTLVAATRNIGIVLSILVGALALRERVSSARLAGALLITGGVIILVFVGH